jgi:hypothetical protein
MIFGTEIGRLTLPHLHLLQLVGVELEYCHAPVVPVGPPPTLSLFKWTQAYNS